jgi:hypothetical protein
VADGTYPNVFNNENPDASFGVTAPIYLDTMSTQGVGVKSFNVTQEVRVQLGRLAILQTVDGLSRQSLRFVELALFVVASADTDTDKNILL